MSILSLENSLTWSWANTSRYLKKILSEKYIRMLIIPGVRISDDLIDFFDIVLCQNVDKLKLMKLSKKILCRSGGMYTGEQPNRFEKQISKVGGIIATNHELGEIARKSNSNVIEIPNGTDLTKFRPLPKTKKTKKFVLGFAGNITQAGRIYKGWKYFADVRNYLFSQTDELICNWKNKIPHKDMPKKFFAKIDCLILPSVNEGCSHIIMEALACGVPVICTKVGYHGENLIDRKNVLFVERDSLDVEKRVLELMNSRELREKLSKNGRLFAEKNHNIIEIAKQYEKAIKMIRSKNG